MTFDKLCKAVRIADLEYPKDELRIRTPELVEAVDNALSIIAKLEAELKCARIANTSMMAQLSARLTVRHVRLEELA